MEGNKVETTILSLTSDNISSVDCGIKYPEYSAKWECYMFGFGDFVWIPLKGKEPNWFWRWMQYLFFGNRWVKIKSKGGEK